ncbi:hypothetical protein JTE90_022968 [Oedothorax gibbosus]|uniref:FAM69 protein-kinase domain-containing protein n=1 Tax=Oedothorax gibbosus TaxID=931172 RepID=A0AAV6VCG0_9ARAC|nr:hypothetical protein JTE90_022968 [Oedothorax gibbosus]
MEMYKYGVMIYSSLLNPEAIILQAFPQAEGWPFPFYYGSCGRVIVEEYAGKTLSHYEDSSWEQRIDISYQLLLIAQTLTENASNFSLYMTDVTMDNFAVRSDGTVLLIDVESIVIVDRLANKEGQNTKIHHSKGEFCKDCLNFSFEDLCGSYQSDHNYYAICKGLLVPGSYFSSKGFLHSIPENINIQTKLSYLVQECASPSETNNRFKVLPKLLQVMKSLL